MNTSEFRKLIQRWHPELLPVGAGAMPMPSVLRHIAGEVGYTINPGDAIGKVLHELWYFI